MDPLELGIVNEEAIFEAVPLLQPLARNASPLVRLMKELGRAGATNGQIANLKD